METEGRQLAPMNTAIKDIDDSSARLIQKANQSYTQERRVVQRHRLVCVACVECSMTFEGRTFKFWVYGDERKVYPGGCCCCFII